MHSHLAAVAALAAGLAATALGQSRLPSMPGWQDHSTLRPKLQGVLQGSFVNSFWVDAETLAYQDGQEWVVLTPKDGKESRQAQRPESPAPQGRQGRRPGRGRQLDRVESPDGSSTAFYRDGNLHLSKGGVETPITTEGSVAGRVKYGTGSWVYGEELSQNEAFGWSPDGKLIWYYRFDERQVLDYHLVLDHQAQQSRMEVEAYPKPGRPNPVVDLFVYSLDTGKSVPVKVRPGAFDDGMGHYVYGMRWRPDSKRLLFYRLDRKQQALELCSTDPATGDSKVLAREENPNGWVESMPMEFLDQHQDIAAKKEYAGKALYLTERTGFINIALLDLETGASKAVTSDPFDVRRIIRVDLLKGEIDYAANCSQPGLTQLRRVRLSGGASRRITDPALDHTVQVAPGGKWILDRTSRADLPGETRVLDSDGKVVKVIRKASAEGLAGLGYRTVDRLSFTAADGKTPLSGVLHYPVKFDPSRRYPLIVSVYGGPLGPMADSWSESFRMPASWTDFGFFVLEVENRGLGGRGRAFKDSLYKKMGITEVDDVAAAVKSLAGRPGLDLTRVGIEGTSYGGYLSLMALLRYPDVFHAACPQSCVSDWRNYDTIYTERYMGLLPESEDAYKAGSAMTYLDRLSGWLLLYFGTADDNTHPSNTLQVAHGLNRLGRSFELQAGVDAGHSGLNRQRLAEFFIERLVMDRAPAAP